jgi:hypothetical protein
VRSRFWSSCWLAAARAPAAEQWAWIRGGVRGEGAAQRRRGGGGDRSKLTGFEEEVGAAAGGRSPAARWRRRGVNGEGGQRSEQSFLRQLGSFLRPAPWKVVGVELRTRLAKCGIASPRGSCVLTFDFLPNALNYIWPWSMSAGELAAAAGRVRRGHARERGRRRRPACLRGRGRACSTLADGGEADLAASNAGSIWNSRPSTGEAGSIWTRVRPRGLGDVRTSDLHPWREATAMNFRLEW